LSFYDCNINTINTSGQPTVSVFPNPTGNVINIVADDVHLIELYDPSGNKIISTNIKTINLREFNNGIYILRVHTNYGIKVFKIVIEKQ
jgi:hypothetical protein